MVMALRGQALLWRVALVCLVGRSIAVELRVPMQASAAERVRSRFETAMDSITITVADAEMGADLGAHLGKPASIGHVDDQGPATLAEYCAGDTKQEHKLKLQKGTKVMVDWKEYGTYYPGKITDQNSDGTVDVHYDDGFDEKNVEAQSVKPKEGESLIQKPEEVKGKQRQNDAACKMQDFLGKLNEKLGTLNTMTSQFLAAQRAKLASTRSLPPPPHVKPVVAPETHVASASPSAAPPSDPASAPPASEELEELKVQLADKDTYISELKKMQLSNAKELNKYLPAASPAPPSGMKTVADLIADYKAQIAQRDTEIEALLKEIKDQEQQLAVLGARQVSLSDIDAAVEGLEADVEEAQHKRNELEEEGELDPDLRMVLDGIIQDVQNMRKKVDNLVTLNAKAKARKAVAEREAALAIQEAREKAEQDGEDPDKAAAEATEEFKRQADEANKEADLETLKAAQDVKKDLDEAEQGAMKLDTGLHPHGEKWWRYRYEHSYIEAMLMIFISFLMLFWSRIMHHLKHSVKVWSLPRTAQVLQSNLEEIDNMQATFYQRWLRHFCEQMTVCILVFLTVWVIAGTQLIDLFPIIIKPEEDMHVPQTASEYHKLLFDICTIYFFAILFYFCLMFPVAHDTMILTRHFEDEDQGSEFKHLGGDVSSSARDHMSKTVMGTLARSKTGLAKTESHFVKHMREEMMTRQEPEMKEIVALLNNDINAFPLWKYLILNVRLTAASLLEFSWAMWIPVVACFMCFMLMHRFAHIGYVRIMMCFAVVVLGLIVAMAWYIKRMARMLEEDTEPSEGTKQSSQSFNIETLVLGAFQFALFFLCYGIARMICQKWMWELHFWTVLGLTIIALVQVILFVTLVSPAIPSFCGVMALPPHVDAHNLGIMLHVAKGVELTSTGV